MKITGNPDPALELASRIYSYRNAGESWTDAVDAFAREVLFRHPRTVHRWLSGESPIPQVIINEVLNASERVYSSDMEEANV